MLTKDPRKRATISELLEHPWLNMEVNRSKNPAKTRRKSALSQVPDAVVSRLQQFAAMNRFKKEARKILATFLPEEEVRGTGLGGGGAEGVARGWGEGAQGDSQIWGTAGKGWFTAFWGVMAKRGSFGALRE